MKFIEYIAVAVALGGALLNKLNWPLGDLLLIAGLGSLAFLYALTGSIFSKIKEKRGFMMPFTVFSSLTLAAGLLSLLFSHMGWELRGLLAIYSFIALPLVIILNIYQLSQKSENPLNKMFAIRASLILLAIIVF
jgi:hypothetical protein